MPVDDELHDAKSGRRQRPIWRVVLEVEMHDANDADDAIAGSQTEMATTLWRWTPRGVVDLRPPITRPRKAEAIPRKG
jgi:hypothetical protein